MIIGGHAGGGRRIGDVDFGATAAEFTEAQITLQWYDFLFKGVQNQFAKKPIRIFVMGANEWRDEEQWPLKRALESKFFLHSTKAANSSLGGGALSGAAPANETSDEFVYDVANPVPTTGGPLCCDPAHLPAGPRDQRAVEARDDVLVYSTPPLDRDTEITGHVSLELWVKSTAADTDFTGKLVDVWPNGFAQNLTEGILRAKYRNSQEKPELLTPGEPYLLSIDLWSTSNVFKKGHRLRLEVSSSNFPRFDRNMNTGEDSQSAVGGVKATNQILHDSAHASVLLLPVVQ